VINLVLILSIPALVGIIVLLVLVVLTLASITLTLLTYRRVEQRNVWLKAGGDAVLPNPWWGRLVDRLVPDVVLVNTFPRMSLITEYQELSGHHRKLIVWNPKLGRPSALRREAGERSERQAALPR